MRDVHVVGLEFLGQMRRDSVGRGSDGNADANRVFEFGSLISVLCIGDGHHMEQLGLSVL